MDTQMRGNRSLIVLATIAVIFLLYWGEAFFVPLLVALMLSYALAPVVRALTFVVRYRVIAAALVVSTIVASGGIAMWAWSDVPSTLRLVLSPLPSKLQSSGPAHS